MTEPRMTHDDAIELAAAYALGALDRTDEAAVRDHLASCGLPHPEFEVFSGVVPSLWAMDDLEIVEPPAALGDRIMAAAAADLAANPRTASAEAAQGGRAPNAPRPAPDARSGAPLAFPSAADRAIRAEPTRTSRFDWALRIAAVLAIVAVGVWGLNLQSQLDASRRFDQAVASVIQAAGQPNAKTVVLTAAKDATASGIGAVASDGTVTLAVRDLAPTTGSQVYETWVIVGKAAPVPVGGFTVDANGTASFKAARATDAPPGAIIALSLEPAEGSTAPLGPIVSTGLAVAPPGEGS